MARKLKTGRDIVMCRALFSIAEIFWLKNYSLVPASQVMNWVAVRPLMPP